MTVRSSAKPGSTSWFLVLVSSAVTRGGEYISDSRRLHALRFSRGRAYLELPKSLRIIRLISSSGVGCRDPKNPIDIASSACSSDGSSTSMFTPS